MTVVYENVFDWNEWMVLITLVSLNILIWITPKTFSLLEGTAYYMYGIFIGMFFDHTISVLPWDFYDVNDSSEYQVMDFLSYVKYGPFSYFFIYLYVKLRIKGFMHIIYILAWTCFSLLMEGIGVKVGLFHYGKGYIIYYSIPIYLFVQSIQIIYYHVIKSK
jgi:hypothetical protein